MFAPSLLLLLGSILLTLFPHASSAGQLIQHAPIAGRPQCTVLSSSNTTTSDDDDVPALLSAFSLCNHGGDIHFPSSQRYTIASKLNPVLHDVRIRWGGTWVLKPDIEYWRNSSNHFPIAFQNHAAAFVISGEGIMIDGEGTGGIDGNGETWYTAEEGFTRPGRPMPCVFWNVSDVTVRNFAIRQPPLWALNIMNGTDMLFENIYVNATASRAPWGTNWVQNTDGFDTMDATNITLTNLTYQGGDDCVAIKPRSSHIFLSHIHCIGGNGIAIGSLGQYAGVDASVSHVRARNVTVSRYNDDLTNSAYVKTWIGVAALQNASQNGAYESGGVPRGAGVGVVQDVRFEGFVVEGAEAGPAVTQDSGDDAEGTFAGTSRMLVRDLAFVGFRGWLEEGAGEVASVSCSRTRPCEGIVVEDVVLTDGEGGERLTEGECKWVAQGGVRGLNGTGCV
ncbi:putative galacturan 1,4-alpha-galacturonidase C [Phyllosticta capitalensis]|uniref:galacturonan 1,4-alpha-galacturonidase n=1 Tax=Phyllosticta capitalensis TaxID=121624 RepID=A0ABR1YQD7_9PEZI